MPLSPGANAPPPTVWWSAPDAIPQPTGFWNQLAPSLSVKAIRLQSADSCETNVRPVVWSVKRIGSSDAVDVIVEPTLAHVARTRRVVEARDSGTPPEVGMRPLGATRASAFQITLTRESTRPSGGD